MDELNLPTLYLGARQSGKTMTMLNMAYETGKFSTVTIHCRDEMELSFINKRISEWNLDGISMHVIVNPPPCSFNWEEGEHFITDVRPTDQLFRLWQDGDITLGRNVHLGLFIDNAMLRVITSAMYPSVNEQFQIRE